MAHKPKSYYIDAEKKIIVLYTNVEANEAEKQMREYYLSNGFTVLLDEKKKSPKKDEMLAELEKNAPEKAEEFKAYYNGEKKMYKEDGEKLQPFFAACKVYQAYKKEVRQKEKQKKNKK